MFNFDWLIRFIRSFVFIYPLIYIVNSKLFLKRFSDVRKIRIIQASTVLAYENN